jgi:hypothetical protein
MADSDHEHLRTTALLGKVARVRMAHRDGGVRRLEHTRDRLADDKGTSDDGDVGPIQRTAIVVEQRHHGLRRARCEPTRSAREHPIQRAWRDAIDVLGRVERRAGGLLVERGREWAEHEAAMDGGVPVHAGDGSHEVGLRAVGGKHDPLDLDADLLAALAGTALIGEVVRTLSHPDDRELGDHALRLERHRAQHQPLGERSRHRSTFE